MPVPETSTNYGWDLPTIGGDIGAWGGILNTIIGEDGATGGVKGIDQVIADLQLEVDNLEIEVTDLETRIEVLEATPLSAFFARTILSSDATIPKAKWTKLSWGSADFDEGSVASTDVTKMTVPSGGAGLWLLRVSVESDWTAGLGDDCRRWEVEIRKNETTVVAHYESPYQNDGVHTGDSGDITHLAAAIDQAAESDYYEVYVYQTFFDKGTSSGTVKKQDGTYFEAVRVAPEIV